MTHIRNYVFSYKLSSPIFEPGGPTAVWMFSALQLISMVSVHILSIYLFFVITVLLEGFINDANYYKQLIKQCDCPQPCGYTKYDATLSCGSFPSANLAPYYSAKLNISQDKIRYVYG